MINISAKATPRVAHNFHPFLIRVAKDSAKSAEEFESSGDKSAQGEELQAAVCQAVIFSMCYLEALVNRKVQDAVDEGLIMDLEKVLRMSTLDRFQHFLDVKGKERFDRGRRPFQDIDLVRLVRNAIVHYRFEWDGDGKHLSLETAVGSRFAENQLASPNMLWFPHRCLGAGCARFATDSAVAFAEEFESKMLQVSSA